MAAPRFVHLRLHTEYTVVDGMARVDEAVAAAAADSMPALAITDSGNLFGAIKFYEAARGAGVQPVIGCDLWITNERSRTPLAGAVLAATMPAISRSARSSRAHAENHWRRAEVARVLRGTQGLIALGGHGRGSALAAGTGRGARCGARVGGLSRRVHIGSARRPAARGLVRASATLAAELGSRSSRPSIQFVRPDSARTGARVHHLGYVLATTAGRANSASQYFKTRRNGEPLPISAGARELGRDRAPLRLRVRSAEPAAGLSHAGRGVDRGLPAHPARGPAAPAALYPAAKRGARGAYRERLEFERTIIRWASPATSHRGGLHQLGEDVRRAGGPGRGSGAGSSWPTRSASPISIDPLRAALRALPNPERVSMPDFTRSVLPGRARPGIDYVKQKYGAQCVSQIATFGTMAAKAAVRDVGACSMPYGEVDRIAKLIPFELASRSRRRLRRTPAAGADEGAEEVAEPGGAHGSRACAQRRHARAACSSRLCSPTAAARQRRGSGAMVTVRWDDVEKAGLVKFDFLGLTTLTILDWAVRASIDSATPDSSSTTSRRRQADLPCCEGPRRGVPARIARQRPAEAPGSRTTSRGDRAGGALSPGPMDLIPDFIERSTGARRCSIPTAPGADPGPTYGIMVYQEQVMQIAQVLGGYSLGGADPLPRDGQEEGRGDGQQRAIPGGRGEERPDRLQGRRDLRPDGEVRGLRLQPLARSPPTRCWHQTAPEGATPGAFMAANLSLVMGDTDKVQVFHDDAIDRPGDPAARHQRPTTASRRSTQRIRSAVRSRAPASRRSRTSSPRARPPGRFAISRTSAAGSTGAW
jgi:DNA polymerase-3 subunit alpha